MINKRVNSVNVWPVLLPVWLQEDNCSTGDRERRDRHLFSESGDHFLQTISVGLLIYWRKKGFS